jgi:hypothetical protein
LSSFPKAHRTRRSLATNGSRDGGTLRADGPAKSRTIVEEQLPPVGSAANTPIATARSQRRKHGFLRQKSAADHSAGFPPVDQDFPGGGQRNREGEAMALVPQGNGTSRQARYFNRLRAM